MCSLKFGVVMLARHTLHTLLAAAIATAMLALPNVASTPARSVPIRMPVTPVTPLTSPVRGVARAPTGLKTAGARSRVGTTTPEIALRRTVIRKGQRIVFAGRAAVGSKVRLSAVMNGPWTFIGHELTVGRSGRVWLSAPLPKAGTHLVRADVVSPDRSTRYGFGPYVVTVVPRRAPMPTYVQVSFADLLASPNVAASVTRRPRITVGGAPFVYEGALRGAPQSQWTVGVVAKAIGCIGMQLEFAIADGEGGDRASMQVINPWAGRGGHGTVGPGAIGQVATLLDGGAFRIKVASNGSKVYVRGMLTCPRAALSR